MFRALMLALVPAKKVTYNGVLYVVQRGQESDIFEGAPDLGYQKNGTWEDIA